MPVRYEICCEVAECKVMFKLNICSKKDSTGSFWKFSNQYVCCIKCWMTISISYDPYYGCYGAMSEMIGLVESRLMNCVIFEMDSYTTEREQFNVDSCYNKIVFYMTKSGFMIQI